MKYKEYSRIVRTKTIGHYLLLKLETENIAQNALPGQFVNIRVGEGYDPLLRRPISISDIDGHYLTLVILIRGKGTQMLANKRLDDTINLIGPLGNSFPSSDKDAIFIAGGIGLAPFLNIARNSKNPTLLLGVRNADLLPPLEDEVFDVLKDKCDILISSDDGSVGIQGNTLDLLKKLDFRDKIIYACGPNPMFKALQSYFKTLGFEVDAHFSLESYMGCGFGACKGCAVEMNSGEIKLCCVDGAVFKWDEVKF